jgi:hypothetical protein
LYNSIYDNYNKRLKRNTYILMYFHLYHLQNFI